MNCMAADARRILRSWQLYAAVAAVLVAAVLTFPANLKSYNLQYLDNIGGLNRFIYSAIVGNAYMLVVAPFAATVVSGTLLYDDLRTGFSKPCTLLIGPRRYVLSKCLSTALWGALTFAIAYGILLVVCCIVDPSPSVRTDFRFGFFLWAFDRSLLLYCGMFILHAMLYGAVYALFSMGFSLVCKNKYIALGAPVALYYIASYYPAVFPRNIIGILNWFLPFRTFEIATVDQTLKNFGQLLFILLLACCMIVCGVRQWRKGTW